MPDWKYDKPEWAMLNLGYVRVDVYFTTHEVYYPAGRWQADAPPFMNGFILEGCKDKEAAKTRALKLLHQKIEESYLESLRCQQC